MASRSRASRAGDLWFALDPSLLFLVDGDGRLVSANPAGEAAIANGQLLSLGTGALGFGSADCDAAFLAGVRKVADKGGRLRLVLRQRHGGWVGAGLYGAPDEGLVIVALQEELKPTAAAMAAMSDAFHLTAAEADVLQHLLAGECPK
ncbi:hypothetical protein SAMN05192570_2622 [Brevundimonas viscosa]|uniref:PAS domain-containing protein n=1 Tax=Brevundimonas viscosa TaxID=871741 RepID=A0A1I6SNU8_9CAUL|nr:hypothetical protein SAMN05192570_2622 [Brevundimonas viscosa]